MLERLLCPRNSLITLPKELLYSPTRRLHAIKTTYSNMVSYNVSLFRRDNDFSPVEKSLGEMDSQGLFVFKSKSEYTVNIKLQDLANSSSFSSKDYFNALQTNGPYGLGNTLLHMGAIHSTQTLLQYNVNQLPIGTVAVADVQETGKGRGSNIWESPDGNMAFTLKAKVDDIKNIVFIQYLVSLDLVRAVDDLVQVDHEKNKLRLKWPNDIYYKDMKIGGILCSVEKCMDSEGYIVYCGVGLNTNNPGPTTCLSKLYTNAEAQAHLTKEKITAKFCNIFSQSLAEFSKTGFESFVEMYYQKWLHSNQKVMIVSVNSEVTIKGLTKDGYLLAFDQDAKECALHPDHNSLDLFKGLIKKKL